MLQFTKNKSNNLEKNRKKLYDIDNREETKYEKKQTRKK